MKEGVGSWIGYREKINDNASPMESLPSRHGDLEQDLLVAVSHWIAMAGNFCLHLIGSGYPWEG